MKKIIITTLIILAFLVLGYLLFWPKPISESGIPLLEEPNSQESVLIYTDEPNSMLEIELNSIEQVTLPVNEMIVESGSLEELAEIVNSNIDEEVINIPLDTIEIEAPQKEKMLLSVPFIAQAPLGNWSDPRQQDACEEAGTLMAMAWVNNDKEPSLLEAEKQIIELANWQQENYGEHRDLHIEEVASRLFGEHFNYEKVEIKAITKVEELIDFLEQGYLILVPSNGQALKNPYFTAPGPERHLLVIIGYDYEAELFITNDPGTRQGRNFKYPKERLFEAIRVYPSGYHEPIVSQEKLVLLVSK